MVESVAIPLIVSLVGVLVSVITTVFIAGTRTGKTEQKLDDVVNRLAKIEGMFTLRLKDEDK
jgi:hypothetical protein